MSWAILAAFAQHGPTKPPPPERKPYRKSEFRLVGGEVITAPGAAKDPRNVHGLTTKSMRRRLQKGVLTEEELFAAPKG